MRFEQNNYWLMNIKKWSVDGQKTWRIQLHRGHLIHIPSGKRLHNYGKSPFLMGKSTISMAIFNSYVSHYQRVIHINGDSTTQTYGLNQLAAMGDCIQGKRFAEIHSPSIFPNRNLFFFELSHWTSTRNADKWWAGRKGQPARRVQKKVCLKIENNNF